MPGENLRRSQGRRLAGRAVTSPPRRRKPPAGAVLLTAAVALLLLALSAIAATASGGAPTVETEPANGVGRTGFVLKAMVNPNGSPVTECVFEYGTTETLGTTAPCSYSPGAGETPVPVEATVAGQPETTHYFFRIHAKSAEGEVNGTLRNVSTLPTAPNVSNEPNGPIGHTSATLNGSVTPNDSEVTECFFEYGTSPSNLTSQAPCSALPGAGSEPVLVHATISGLPESTAYYYKLVARNAYGVERGNRGNLETQPSEAKVTIDPAREVTHTTALLYGHLTPNSEPVEECYFQWGIHSVEENRAPCEQTELGSGEAPEAVSARLTGLVEGQTYHFHLVVKNVRGMSISDFTGFTTLPFTPKTLIGKPNQLTSVSAEAHARINPQDETITGCSFEYGTTPALGNNVKCSSLPGAGEKYAAVSAPITGLSPTTTYLIRIKAVDASGATYSREESFTTYQAGLLPVVTKLKPKKGSSAGGTSVTIRGEHLSGAKAVRFGETETTEITSDSAESLTVVSPAGVGTVDVTVITESGQSATSSADQFTYGKPTITGVSPNHGPVGGGTEVTVTGTGFEPGGSGTMFLFNKTAATFVECASSSSCTMVAPAAYKARKGTVKVVAKVEGKGSKGGIAATFTYE